MIIWENIRFALSAIVSNKTRAFLTMLGVIIGVFSVITLMGIGEGLRSEFSDQIEGLGSNLIIVIPGNLDLENGDFNPAQTFGASTLLIEDAYALENEVDELLGAAPLVLISGVIQLGETTDTNTMVMGTTQSYIDGADSEIVAGRFFNDQEEENNTRVAVLGGVTADKLFGEDDPIGQKVQFRGEEFEIIGTLSKSEQTSALPTSSMSFEEIMLMPVNTAQEITEVKTAFRVVAKANSSQEVEPAVARIKEVLTERHGEEDFTVITQEDILEMFNSFFDILNTTVSGIAAISLLVGGIGIMNIMLVSVTERTREIGIRKAVGATSVNILFQFLVESSFISLLGGGVGVGLSYLATNILSNRLNIPAEITPFALLLAIGISVGVGIIFGLLPASQAARKNPIDALRYE